MQLRPVTTNPAVVPLRKTSPDGPAPLDQFSQAEQKALEDWKNRLQPELGVLQSPPVGSGSLEGAKNYAESLLLQVAGEDFKANDMQVRLEVFSGDVPQAGLDDTTFLQDDWKDQHPDQAWPIGTYYGVAEGKPFYRVLVNAGLLRTLATRDELAFVLAQESSRLISHHKGDPQNEDQSQPDGQNWLEPGTMQAGADREGVERMVAAGFNPEGARTALERLYQAFPAKASEDDNQRAIDAAAAGHEQEGLRFSLVQTRVEDLKKRQHPTTQQPQQPLPANLAPPGPSLYEPSVKDFPKFQKAFTELADQLTGESTPLWMFGGQDKPPQVREIRRTPASSEDYQQALLGLAEHLQQQPLTPQQKVDGFLRLLLAVKADCLPEDRDFRPEVVAQLSGFLAAQVGWQPELLLASLQGPKSLHRELATELQLNPHFQAMLAPLGSGFQRLTDLAPENYIKDPKTGEAQPRLVADFYERNQAELESTYPQAPALDAAVLKFLKSLDPQPLGQAVDEAGLPVVVGLTNQLLSTPRQSPDELQRMREALQGHLKVAHEVREDHARLRLRPPLSQPELLTDYQRGLFDSENWGGFTSTFEQQLPGLLLDVARCEAHQVDLVFDQGRVGALEPGQERRLAELLQHSQNEQDRQAVQRTLLRHWQHEQRVPSTSPRRQWSQPLAAALAQQPLSQLLQPDRSQHDGAIRRTYLEGYQLTPEDLPDTSKGSLEALDKRREAGEFEPKRENYASEEEYLRALVDYNERCDKMAEAMEFLAPAESRLTLSALAILGHDAKTSQEVASRLNPEGFRELLGTAEQVVERSKLMQRLATGLVQEPLGVDAGAFLLDGLKATQSQIQDLEAYYDLASRSLDLAPGALEARSGTRKALGNHLYGLLDKLPQAELRGWLAKEHVLDLLAPAQSAQLMIKHLGDLCRPEGDVAALTEAVAGLNKDFKLQEERVVIYHELRNSVAEKARLQPGNIDTVFPEDSRDSIEATSIFGRQVRGLSALLAISRGRPPQDQIDTVEYLMGRRKDMPAYLETASESQNFAPIAQSLRNVKEELKEADSMVRVVVANSFLTGPSGILRNPEGREAVLNHFLKDMPDNHRELAEKVGRAILESQGDADSLAVAFMLGQKPPPPKEGDDPDQPGKLDQAQILSRLFDSYGVPGIKMKQYLAFTSEFEAFREAFESAQDSAMPLNYFQVLKLIQKRFGDEWPQDLQVERILGSGSVNVAIRYFNKETNQREVVSLGRDDIIESTRYDFGRFERFLHALTKDPKDKEQFGYILGLLDIIHHSVDLEFDKEEVLSVQRKAFQSYNHKYDGWSVRSIDAYQVKNLGLFMEEAKGKTARKILQQNPDLYRRAMRPMAKAEMGILRGQDQTGNWWPKAMFSNPDFHDGQVLIDEASKTVTILDFGQAVHTDNVQRETALDMLTFIGKADGPGAAAKRLNKRFFKGEPVLTAEDMKPLAKRKDRMDIFIHLLSLLSQKGADVPISSVHWVLGLNRQLALGTKLGQSVQKEVRNIVLNHKVGLPLGFYNTCHEVKNKVVQWASALAHSLVGWALPKEDSQLDTPGGTPPEKPPKPKDDNWAWKPEDTFLRKPDR